ncbi:RidA family protein [Natronosalvus rutilus]|uniref:RidA family protein n=1 Tax=Natronosalvus rutilus TaxID=2953753 RepID=A0A9E7NFH1_9EURY|nr:RidA family protein [Natronosalvus rutilus]UTF55807.1 RidA family protein [Natronosalvus rutilus]
MREPIHSLSQQERLKRVHRSQTYQRHPPRTSSLIHPDSRLKTDEVLVIDRGTRTAYITPVSANADVPYVSETVDDILTAIYFESHTDCYDMARKQIAPDGLIDASSIGYSHGIVVDGTLFMSGQVGWNEEFELAGEDITSQTLKAFENVEILLESIDRSLADVTKVTAHVVELQTNRDAFFEVWNDVFADPPYPCLTLLGPQQLAQDGLLVELEVEVPVEE